jgi:regulator of replication initiation timing
MKNKKRLKTLARLTEIVSKDMEALADIIRGDDALIKDNIADAVLALVNNLSESIRISTTGTEEEVECILDEAEKTSIENEKLVKAIKKLGNIEKSKSQEKIVSEIEDLISKIISDVEDAISKHEKK